MGVFPFIKVPAGGVPVVILLGSNMENPVAQLRQARILLSQRCGTLQRSSALYRSSPWGPVAQDDFLNQAVLMRSILPPLALLKRLQAIERRMGRIREIALGPRVIDLDILVYGYRSLQQEALQIPHRLLPERRFALIPLREVWPEWKHPEQGTNAAQMLRNCTDRGMVERL